MSCRGHAHPRLGKPISKERFADEFAQLASQAGIREQCLIDLSGAMAKRHAADERAYADVDAHELVFRFAPAVLWLPEDHRLGLLAHELGHVLCKDLPDGGTEDDADEAAASVLGILVEYDCRWPGKGLQRANPRKSPNPGRVCDPGVHKALSAVPEDKFRQTMSNVQDPGFLQGDCPICRTTVSHDDRFA